MKGGKIIRVGKELLKKLETIKTQEAVRGNPEISYCRAGEILSNRIDRAGGIKDNL